MYPRFSAVIPSYNRWQLVREAVESALAQTYPCHEIIVVDDGSTDGTASKLQAEYSSRLRVVTKQNGGVSTARNAGVTAATGDFIAYLDSDDLWEPDKLAIIADAIALTSSTPAFIFSDFRRLEMSTNTYYSATNTQLFPRIFRRFSHHMGHVYTASGLPALQCVIEDYPFFPSTFVLHRTLHDDYRWDPAVRYSEDFNFMAKIADRYPMMYVDRPLATVRMHGSNKSANWRAKLESHLDTLMVTELRAAGDTSKLRSVRRALGRRHVSAARELLGAGHPRAAAVHALRAMKYPSYFVDALIDLIKRDTSLKVSPNTPATEQPR